MINCAGVFDAAGLTVDELSKLVNESAKKWSVNPHIVIALDRSRPTQVYLLGEVTHPGLYSTTKSTEESQKADSSISKSLTISAVLEMGGGLKVDADIRHIHVTRLHPKQVIDLDLWKLMLDGDKKEDLVLMPGDVVYVPKKGTEYRTNDFGKVTTYKNKVRVIGAVKHPGLFPIKDEGEDIGSVIRSAGGFNESTTSISIIVASTNENGSVNTRSIALQHGKLTSEELVKPGDVVVIKTRHNIDKHVLPALYGNKWFYPNAPVGDFWPVGSFGPVGDFGPKLQK